MSALFALYGCGGSGGDGDSSSGSKPPPGGRLSGGAEVQKARAAAARAIPNPGSVTQSSDVDQQDGVTEDVVTVEITDTDNDGVPEVRVKYNGPAVVDTEHMDAKARTGVENVLDQPEGTRLFERSTYGDYKAVEFYRSLAADDLEQDSRAGDLWVDVYTDFNGDDIDHTNYLAGGIWVYVPNEGEQGDPPVDYEFGAFANGGDPFEGAIAGLTGPATYEGNATGVYSRGTGSGRRNEFFGADVTLTADFKDGSDLGTINGQIDNFVYSDGDLVGGNPVLMLEDADIATSNHGFFEGETFMDDYRGDDYRGRWGGQFYDDNHSNSDNHPGAVAGTFGAATTDDKKSFVGAFGARYKDQ